MKPIAHGAHQLLSFVSNSSLITSPDVCDKHYTVKSSFLDRCRPIYITPLDNAYTFCTYIKPLALLAPNSSDQKLHRLVSNFVESIAVLNNQIPFDSASVIFQH